MKPVTDPNLIAMLDERRDAVSDPLVLGQLEYDIDFAQPVPKVREAIGKLPEERRQKALDTWADAFVANERKNGGVGMMADNTARTLARGTFVGPFLDEANALTSSVLHGVTGGNLGSPYDETLAYNRARDRAVDTDYPGLSAAGQIGTALTTGGMAMRAGPGIASAATAGPLAWMAPAATPGARIVQGATAGGLYGATAGFGHGEDGVGNRAETALEGGIGGALLGTAIPAVVDGTRAVSRAASNFASPQRAGYERALANMGDTSVDELTSQIATGTTRHDAATAARTMQVLGEEMAATGGNAQAAIARAMQRMVNEDGISAAAARQRLNRIAGAQANSDLMLGEYPAVAGSNAATRRMAPENVTNEAAGGIDDVGSQQLLDYLANSGSGVSSQMVRTAVNDRLPQLRESLRSTLEGISPGSLDDADSLIAGMERQARADYDAAYNGMVANPQRMRQLPRLFEYYANRTATSAPEVAATIRNAVSQVAVRLPNGQLGTQSLRQMQQGRTTLRGQIEALERQGRADLANEVRPLYRVLTRTMEDMSPAWARANRRWADMAIGERARELGEAFSERAGPRFREQWRQFEQLAPEAQDLVRMEFVQKLIDKIDNAGETHDLAKLFSTPHIKTMVRNMLGDRAALAMNRAARDQHVATTSKNMIGNSRTHVRGMVQREQDGDIGLLAGASNANTSTVRMWLVETLANFLRERRNRQLARIVTTPVSDTPAVAQHLEMMRRGQQRLQRYNTPPRMQLPAAAAAGSQMGRLFAE